MKLTVTAPGKVMIFGEYAVVGGGWSLVAAVDRRVEVTRDDEREGAYSVTGPIRTDESLVRAVLEVVSEAGTSNVSLKPGHFSSDVRPMFRDGQKIGLGSSAASSVAVTAAALGENDLGEKDSIFRLALEAHSRWQGGRGSGAGLAAATWGGWQGYRLTEPTSSLANVVKAGTASGLGGSVTGEVERLALGGLDTIRWEVVALPSEADTRSFLDAVERAAGCDGQPVENVLTDLADIGRAGVEAVESADGDAIIEQVERADATMERLGEVAGVPVVTDAHRTLRDIATAHELAAKPSGAGGGDISLVVGPSDADWESALSAIRAADSLEPVDTTLGAPGVG